MRAFRRAALMVFGLAGTVMASVAPGDAVPGASAKWRSYRSPHFELLSQGGDLESRLVLHNLEVVRAVFFDLFHLEERRPLRLTVFYFDVRRDFDAYAQSLSMKIQVGGYFSNLADRAVIAIAPMWDEEESRRVVYHEFVHYLTRTTGEDPPLWYLEGLAELLCTLDPRGKKLAVGRPIDAHVRFLQGNRMMSLEDLFAYGDSRQLLHETGRAGMLYAESWLLMHYWFFGQSDLPRAQVNRFVEYVRYSGLSSDSLARRKLFQAAFGMDYAAMLKRLETYAVSGRYSWTTVPAPNVASRESYSVRRLSRAEITRELRELAFRLDPSPRSRLPMLESAGRTPADVRALEALGAQASAEGDVAECVRYWEAALAAGSENAGVLNGLCGAEASRWFAQTDIGVFRLPAREAAFLRGLALKAIASAPSQEEGLLLLSYVEATAETIDVTHVNTVQRGAVALTRPAKVFLALALVRIRLGDFETAAQILGAVEQLDPALGVSTIFRDARARVTAAKVGAGN